MQTPRMALSLALSPRSLNRALPVLRSARARSAASKCSMASNTVRVGAAQMTSTNDLDANYNTCARLVKEAAAAGVKLLCFPESFSFIGAREGESLKIAEPVDGPIMQRYCSLAREANIWLSLGGFQEKGPDETHLHNTHVLLDDSGNIRSIYRKIHFELPSAIPQTKCLVEVGKRTLVRTLVPRFDVDVPGNMVYKESAFTAAGDTIVVQDSPVGCLGLTVCYDLRFPELYQQLRFQHHAQVLLVPSAFTKVTGAAHWEILLRARAIETQCYVIAAAQAGKHNDKRESYGDSLIIDPWGTVISRLPDRTSTGIAIAEINLSMIDAVRTRMPISEHRKFNSYWKPASLKKSRESLLVRSLEGCRRGDLECCSPLLVRSINSRQRDVFER